MSGTSENLQRASSGPLVPQTLAAIFGGELPLAEGLTEAIRRLSVLVEVADTVTQRLSLDHQLPRLIELIVEALDAERATLFLHDADAGELFSREARGEGVAEIRIPQNVGIAGSIFGSGVAEIIDDAYRDPRFNAEVDRRTGFRTRSILCVPLRNRADQVIGVTQVLNKRSGAFTAIDMALLEAISRHAASALEQAQMKERLEQARREELELLAITEAISTELHIDTLLTRIVAAATQLLDAERSTLFVYDPAKDELWSKVAEGTEQKQIRIPAAAGIAGAAFTSGDVLNIPDTYADPRFNREIDRTSGFRTRNLLNVPVIDRTGERLGVVQVLNKRGGPFTQVDIRRLKAFSAGIAVALENARLFSDVLALKNYNENILKSLSNGVITLDRNCVIVKVNEAAQRILGLSAEALVNRSAQHAFGNLNAWITRSLDFVAQMGATDYHADTDLKLPDGGVASVNLTVTPFLDAVGKSIGYMLVLEDITREKRVRNTMARYVAKEVVDRLLASGDDVLQGSNLVATVLFSDIRRFSLMSEAMTPRDTVSMLNEYFTEMVEVIFTRGGMLDKYMGDGLMAIFGAPVVGAADADNALYVANDMVRALAALNENRAERGFEAIEMGIGLATGEVLAGSVGPTKRMEYTAIGGNVNLAARLESANKYYGTVVLLAATTVDELRSPAVLRRLDLIQAKGISQPTWVYESLGHHTPLTFPKLAAVVTAYEAGLDCYQRRDWGGGVAHFAEALELAPQDRPSRIFWDRCRYYQTSPPDDRWDGIWIMQEK
ncbi:MAG TPA: GAF domain-containing protein [Stellaceae bacterium]|nr:GAF domain-containing protein [Stellaceae bacterium]